MSDKELNTRTFCSLGIKKWLAENASKLGLCEATAVQRACIPPILKGVDVIGTSQTGSGKTAAFALPILQILSQDSYGIFALCMTPTRELAVQISQTMLFSSNLTLGAGYNWWRRYPSSSKVDFETTPYYSWCSWSFDGSLFKQSSSY